MGQGFPAILFPRCREKKLAGEAVQSPVRKSAAGDFPGGTVLKNPPANAGGHGFEPWSGKIPHDAKERSSCTTTTEPAL